MGSNKFLPVIHALCLLMVFIPGYMMAARLSQYKAAEDSNQKTADLMVSYSALAPGISQTGERSLCLEKFIDIEGLQRENPDIEGYLEIPQTKIAYPVMRSQEPDWYIDRDFYRNPSVCGSIYMDNASYKGGSNLVLYGHNMKSGQMFGTLDAYLDASFLHEHKEIRFITEDGIRIYEVCIVFSASANSQELVKCLIPYTEEEMHELLAFIERSGGRRYASVSWGDSLITLATCEYSQKNGRLFIIGKQTDLIKRDD